MRQSNEKAIVPVGQPVSTHWRSKKIEPLSETDYKNIKGYMQHPYLLLTRVLRVTGLREAEVLRWQPEHIQRRGPDTFVSVYRGKKRGRQTWEDVALHPEVAVELGAYIMYRGVKAGERIFALSARQYQRVFKAAARKALGRDAHPHQLRHLFVTSLIDRGFPVGMVSGLVGHASEQTTLKYYYDLHPEKRQAIARAIEP